MVWRFAFPPSRRIDLSNVKRAKTGSEVKLGVLPLPITLCVNSESRKETFKHYCLIFRQDFLPQALMKKKIAQYKELPLCFDPAKDFLYYPIESASRGFQRKWLKYLDSRLDGGLKAIKFLELRGATEWHLAIDPQLSWWYEFEDLREFLSKFTGLRQLRITFLDTMQKIRRDFRPRDRVLPYPFWEEKFEEMLLRVVGQHSVRAEFLGLCPGPNNHVPWINFQQYAPMTIYCNGNTRRDRWVGWD